MKKTIAIFAFIISITLSVGLLTACGTTDNAGKTAYNASNFYAFGAATAGAIIGDNADTQTTEQPTTPTAPTTPIPSQTEDYTQLENYVALVENFLGSNALSVTESASDREGYAKKIVAINRNISGNAYEYVLYFNESAPVVEIDDDDDDDDDRYEKDDAESESRITGVLVMNGVEYAVSGEKETEGTESEISFTAVISAGNYVKISQETDTNEASFEYEIYTNGVLTEKFELELETKLNETEVELKTVKDGTIEVFEFERKKGVNRDYIEIKTNKNGVREVIKAYVTVNADGTESYSFTK